MMRKYLDPRTYRYDDAEWHAGIFFKRFAALQKFLLEVAKFESDRNSRYKLFVFLNSKEAIDQIWTSNPMCGSGNIHSSFKQTFGNRILPELIRRFRSCPFSETCLEENNSIDEIPPPNTPPHPFDKQFSGILAQCGSCGNKTPKSIFFHDSYKCVDPSHAYFQSKFNIEDNDLTSALMSSELWPNLSEIEKRQQQITDAIKAEYAFAKKMDSSWSNYSLSNFTCSDTFWKSLHKADFGYLEYKYKKRIISCMMQIVCGRDVDLHEHSMNPQTIRIGTKLHGKWNSYVFKMGAGENDKRCSRLYYAKTSNGLYFEEYESDAH